MCRIDASVKLTLKKKFGAVLRVYTVHLQQVPKGGKGGGNTGEILNFVSKGKVGLISDDYEVLQRVPDAL